MSLFSIFDIAGSGMNAQSVRLNTTASNLANAENISSDPLNVYRARQPVFQTVLSDATGSQGIKVKVSEIVESPDPVRREYDPQNSLADEGGYIYKPNVSTVEEMANMISASSSYQSNVEIMNSTKQLLLMALRIGQ